MDEDLSGTRTSFEGNGIDASASWADGGLTISWEIIKNSDGTWTYVYELTALKKDISHFILEITDDGNAFNLLEGSDETFGKPATYSSDDPSNPLMPNSIYGIKSDAEGLGLTYTIVTDRAPVYGIFYAKDGVDNDAGSKEWVAAWSSALNDENYKKNANLTTIDFIVRPNGAEAPIPGAVWLFGSAAAGIVGLRRIRRKST